MRRLLVRFGLGLLVALLGFISYCSNMAENPVTGERQRIQLSPQQEIALGLQARSQMSNRYGGLYPDKELQQYVTQVGKRVVQQSDARKAPYPFQFYLLRDPQTINAFALPGGQIFLTFGLFRRLQSEAQMAAVLGHETGHVVARHGAEHLAKQKLASALVTAVGVAASDDQGRGQQAAVIARAVNQLVGLRYGREDELESDRLGFRFMTQAGYTPQGMVELLQILNNSRRGSSPPEFFSTHPNSGNRIELIQKLIAKTYPNGIPGNLAAGREDFARYAAPRLPSK